LVVITQLELKRLLHYDAVTGLFTWLVRSSTRTHVGDIAGTQVNGYVRIRIGGVLYQASRLAWLWMTSSWPVDEIDHRNTIKDDNRWGNLREGSHSFNMQNMRKARSNSCTGFLGVSLHYKRFKARLWFEGKQHYLGTHATPELAHAAYVVAKRQLHLGGTL